jgi:hypothetical protein
MASRRRPFPFSSWCTHGASAPVQLWTLWTYGLVELWSEQARSLQTTDELQLKFILPVKSQFHPRSRTELSWEPVLPALSFSLSRSLSATHFAFTPPPPESVTCPSLKAIASSLCIFPTHTFSSTLPPPSRPQLQLFHCLSEKSNPPRAVKAQRLLTRATFCASFIVCCRQ